MTGQPVTAHSSAPPRPPHHPCPAVHPPWTAWPSGSTPCSFADLLLCFLWDVPQTPLKYCVTSKKPLSLTYLLASHVPWGIVAVEVCPPCRDLCASCACSGCSIAIGSMACRGRHLVSPAYADDRLLRNGCQVQLSCCSQEGARRFKATDALPLCS